MNPIRLSAIDGSNPIGFLAALGTLRSCAYQGVDARLSWVDKGRWRPVIHGVPSGDALVELLDTERQAWADEPALRYTYVDAKGKTQAELKPPPAEWRRFLQQVRDSGRARSIEQVGAYASDVVTDNNGNTKPTALHFSAGQQRFLDAAQDIHARTGPEELRGAVFGPVTRVQSKSLRWDSQDSADYALRARTPSGDPVRKLKDVGAEWLAFVGLGLLPVAPATSWRGPGLQTTACAHRSNGHHLTWPIWIVPAAIDSVRSVLASPIPSDPSARRVRGIACIHRSSIIRNDKGYGSFSPSQPV